eukprot:TRINITY_DN22135_c0_g1_i4.p1 TRINITY_DN22135_c0_g1~~TRINITY_DN22135_c0_g1_i4.p1  ORF type:complete len:108 (+),score=19.68 TRINITY_DN22135_c0_g1_i4:203-526(+)
MEEQQIILKRTHMTLSFNEGRAVYSPKEGVMTHHYPKFFFDEAEFREAVGDNIEGAVVVYTVVDQDSRTSHPDPDGPIQAAPVGGFVHSDTVCKIISAQPGQPRGKH